MEHEASKQAIKLLTVQVETLRKHIADVSESLLWRLLTLFAEQETRVRAAAAELAGCVADVCGAENREGDHRPHGRRDCRSQRANRNRALESKNLAEIDLAGLVPGNSVGTLPVHSLAAAPSQSNVPKTPVRIADTSRIPANRNSVLSSEIQSNSFKAPKQNETVTFPTADGVNAMFMQNNAKRLNLIPTPRKKTKLCTQISIEPLQVVELSSRPMNVLPADQNYVSALGTDDIKSQFDASNISTQPPDQRSASVPVLSTRTDNLPPNGQKNVSSTTTVDTPKNLSATHQDNNLTTALHENSKNLFQNTVLASTIESRPGPVVNENVVARYQSLPESSDVISSDKGKETTNREITKKNRLFKEEDLDSRKRSLSWPPRPDPAKILAKNISRIKNIVFNQITSSIHSLMNSRISQELLDLFLNFQLSQLPIDSIFPKLFKLFNTIHPKDWNSHLPIVKATLTIVSHYESENFSGWQLVLILKYSNILLDIGNDENSVDNTTKSIKLEIARIIFSTLNSVCWQVICLRNNEKALSEMRQSVSEYNKDILPVILKYFGSHNFAKNVEALKDTDVGKNLEERFESYPEMGKSVFANDNHEKILDFVEG
ncbi:hypothetical protein HK096_007974, partial [Nowakowskiella sp. JEL0078]